MSSQEANPQMVAVDTPQKSPEKEEQPSSSNTPLVFATGLDAQLDAGTPVHIQVNTDGLNSKLGNIVKEMTTIKETARVNRAALSKLEGLQQRDTSAQNNVIRDQRVELECLMRELLQAEQLRIDGALNEQIEKVRAEVKHQISMSPRPTPTATPTPALRQPAEVAEFLPQQDSKLVRTMSVDLGSLSRDFNDLKKTVVEIDLKRNTLAVEVQQATEVATKAGTVAGKTELGLSKLKLRTDKLTEEQAELSDKVVQGLADLEDGFEKRLAAATKELTTQITSQLTKDFNSQIKGLSERMTSMISVNQKEIRSVAARTPASSPALAPVAAVASPAISALESVVDSSQIVDLKASMKKLQETNMALTQELQGVRAELQEVRAQQAAAARAIANEFCHYGHTLDEVMGALGNLFSVELEENTTVQPPPLVAPEAHAALQEARKQLMEARNNVQALAEDPAAKEDLKAAKELLQEVDERCIFAESAIIKQEQDPLRIIAHFRWNRKRARLPYSVVSAVCTKVHSAISVDTVENHIQAALQELRAENLEQAAAAAVGNDPNEQAERLQELTQSLSRFAIELRGVTAERSNHMERLSEIGHTLNGHTLQLKELHDSTTDAKGTLLEVGQSTRQIQSDLLDHKRAQQMLQQQQSAAQMQAAPSTNSEAGEARLSEQMLKKLCGLEATLNEKLISQTNGVREELNRELQDQRAYVDKFKYSMAHIPSALQTKVEKTWIEKELEGLVKKLTVQAAASVTEQTELREEFLQQINDLAATLRSLDDRSSSKAQVKTLEKALSDGIGTLRHALSGKVEKNQLDAAISQMQATTEDGNNVAQLMEGLTLVAKELKRKADITALKAVEGVIADLEHATAKPSSGASLVRRPVAGMCLSCNQEILIVDSDSSLLPTPSLPTSAPFVARQGSDPGKRLSQRSSRYYRKAPLYEGVDPLLDRSPTILPEVPSIPMSPMKHRKLVPVTPKVTMHDGLRTAR